MGRKEEKRRTRSSKQAEALRNVTAWRTIMEAPSLLLGQWTQQVKEIFPQLHGHQQKGLAFAVLGVALTGQGVLQQMSEEISLLGMSDATMPSIERRLQRLIANERIDPLECWKTFLAHILPFWHDKEVILVLDCTPYTEEFTIIYLGLQVHHRVLPLAWKIMPQQTTWEQGQWELVRDLFAQVASYFPAANCTLIADRGLSCLELIRLCQQAKWHYLLRISSEHLVRRQFKRGDTDWQQVGAFISKEGLQWYGKALIWKEHSFPASLAVCWEPGYEEVWIVISDLPPARKLIVRYGWRMRVEATFQDTKSRGWNIECSAIRDAGHLNRFFLVLFLAMWWVAHLGSACMEHGHRHRFDRADRRDKGLLRLGRLYLRFLLTQVEKKQLGVRAAHLANCLPFHRGKDGWSFSIRGTRFVT
jgi:DDE family transposase